MTETISSSGALELSFVQWYLMLGVVVAVAGIVRLLLVRDLVARLIAMNVVGSGSLLALIALAARSQPIDPVLSALVITGLVITVAFTGVGAALIRRIEAADAVEAVQAAEGTPRDSDAGGRSADSDSAGGDRT